MRNVKCCKDEQLFFNALCSFIRKKKSIHIFSYTYLAAFHLLTHLGPAGEARLCSTTDSPAFRGRNANYSFCTEQAGFSKPVT